MKEFLFEIKEVVHENGIFFVLFLLVFGIPIFLIEFIGHLIISPFILFNEWSKSWFKGQSQ